MFLYTRCGILIVIAIMVCLAFQWSISHKLTHGKRLLDDHAAMVFIDQGQSSTVQLSTAQPSAMSQASELDESIVSAD